MTGIACPDCPGVLRARVDGAGHLITFVCRIGHVFSRDELLAAKERRIEDSFWAAVLCLEELTALLRELVTHDRRHGQSAAAEFETRARSADEHAKRVRQLIKTDKPVTLQRLEDRAHP